ncbi:class I SAM-dependent methyltransferase [uncultured Pseudodesulfovibrio sp.]|uniref:class I SAM-dependent methyltransferase n=1 Tax=uncultured Pseudodesulfovibrio sp. TaxID=2035858 RepID=UPI0029C8E9FB|nr:class I SAM-dependent methyltransferase [uncultured Pseudodesulfovibrio sp.]
MSNAKALEIWEKRAELHAAKKGSMIRNLSSEQYNDNWWAHISPLLDEIKGGKILEAGCGTGRWAERLVPMGFDLVLSDFSPNMIAKAREHAAKLGYEKDARFEVLDVCDLHSLTDDSFDMVISTGEPITLCADPEQAIAEYCRVVRPGGYVLCDAGNRIRKAYDLATKKPSAKILQVLETGQYTSANGMELHLLSPEILTGIFAKLGMELKTLAGITPMGTFPPDPLMTKALEDDDTYRAMETINREYATRPEIINLSHRLIAVARKPL